MEVEQEVPQKVVEHKMEVVEHKMEVVEHKMEVEGQQVVAKIETIPRGIETTTIQLKIPYEFPGLKDLYELNEASVAKAANLSLRMAKNIIIEECLHGQPKKDTRKAKQSKPMQMKAKQSKPENNSEEVVGLVSSSPRIFKRSFNGWCIYAADNTFTEPATIGFTKKREPIFSFTSYDDSREFVLFYDRTSVPEITTRTEVELLNLQLIKTLYVAAVDALKGNRVNLSNVKYTLISPFMIKAILDSAGFGCVIPLSIVQGFGFDNFDKILENLKDIIEWIEKLLLPELILPELKNELLEFIIGIQLSIVYKLDSSDILGAVNGLRILRNLHDTLPAVGVIDITKAGGGQRGYDNIVFVFAIILENIFSIDTIISYGSHQSIFLEYIQIIKNKVLEKLKQHQLITGPIDGPSLKKIIRAYLFDQMATDNISNIVTIFTIVTEIVAYFLTQEGQTALVFFLDEISSLYDPKIGELTIATCEEFTMLGFQMQKWYQVKRFWPKEFQLPYPSYLTESGIHFNEIQHFTGLINKFKEIYKKQLPFFEQEVKNSTFLIFLYEAACGHDLLSEIITSWLIDLFPHILEWVKQYNNATASGYAWDAIHSQVIKRLQQETRCQICLTSFEVTQIHDLSGISGKFTLFGLNSSLCANSQVTTEIANITTTFKEKLKSITIKTPRGEPAPSAYPGIPIHNLELSYQIVVVDLQKYLSPIQRETINAQRMSQLQGISVASVSAATTNLDVEITELSSAINYGYERAIAIDEVKKNQRVLQVLPIVTRCDEASGVECPRAYYQFGSQEYVLESSSQEYVLESSRFVPVIITFQVTQTNPDYQEGLYRLVATDHTTTITTALASVRDEKLKELLIFLKQTILYKSNAVNEISGGEAVTENISHDYDRMCVNIAKNISTNAVVGNQVVGNKELFKLIKLGLFNPTNIEQLKFIVITPESIDSLISFLFMNGKQRLITYILNFIKEQIAYELVAVPPSEPIVIPQGRPTRTATLQKKQQQIDPQKVIVKINGFLEIIDSLKPAFLVSGSLEISDFCMLNANLHVIQIAKKSGLFISKVAKRYNRIYFHLPNSTELIALSFDTLVQMSQEDRMTFGHRISEIFSHEILEIRKREEAVSLREKKVKEDEEKFVYLWELFNPDQKAEINTIFAEKSKRKISEINDNTSGGGCEFAISSGGVGCPSESSVGDNIRNCSFEIIYESDHYAKRGDNIVLDNAANGIELLSRKTSNTEVESNEIKTLEKHHKSNPNDTFDQHGGASELKDGDIIVGKQNPDGTIEYMLYSDYFKLVFGINEKEVIKPTTSGVSSLGFTIPTRPIEHNIGDIVSEEEAKRLKKNEQFDYKQTIHKNGNIQYELIQYRQPVTGVHTLHNLPKSPVGLGEGQVYATTSSDIPVLVGGRPTRRHKIKTSSKRKTRKHKKIKHKKYTRPYKVKKSKRNTYKNNKK
jgi:hypothetical protein